MATVAHSTLTGAELHEPKGVASAGANQVYTANGSGSGTWSKIGQLSLDGVTSTATYGRFVTTNGTGGFRLTDTAHGTCYFNSTTTPQTMPTIPATGLLLLPTTIGKGTPQSITEGTDGRLTYTGTGSVDLHIKYSICFDIASGGNKNVRFAIRRQLAVEHADSVSYVTGRHGEICYVSGTADVAASTNQYFHVSAFADSGTTATIRIYSYTLTAITAGA